MNTIITTSGKEYDCSFLGEASVGVLYIVIEHSNIGTVATVFSDINETSTLKYRYETIDGQKTDEFLNYVVMVSINQMANGATRVGLRRPYIGENI